MFYTFGRTTNEWNIKLPSPWNVKVSLTYYPVSSDSLLFILTLISFICYWGCTRSSRRCILVIQYYHTLFTRLLLLPPRSRFLHSCIRSQKKSDTYLPFCFWWDFYHYNGYCNQLSDQSISRIDGRFLGDSHRSLYPNWRKCYCHNDMCPEGSITVSVCSSYSWYSFIHSITLS